MTLGKGRAAAITDSDLAALADALKCHPADVEAIAEVESSGFGWFRDGRIKILFEKHWFYKLVPAAKRDESERRGLARRRWVSPSQGGYKDQKTADQRYRLLEEAMVLDREGALQSISIGRFQIMGFNHKICGFSSAEAMWVAFLDSEANQLRAFGNFLKSKGLVAALRARDFAKVEKGYNGGGLGGAYARRMKVASDRLRSTKWNDWKSSSESPATPLPKRPDVAMQRDEAACGHDATVDQQPLPDSNGSAATGGSASMLRALIALIRTLFGRCDRSNWTSDQDHAG